MSSTGVDKLRRFLVALALLLTNSELSCAQHQSGSMDIVAFPGSGGPSPSAVSLSRGYTLETPIRIIAADPEGAAVINKDIPGLLSNPNYEFFKGMNLKLLASFSGGRLTSDTLARTAADLAALPKRVSSRQ